MGYYGKFKLMNGELIYYTIANNIRGNIDPTIWNKIWADLGISNL